MEASFGSHHTIGVLSLEVFATTPSHFQASFVQSIPGRVDTNKIGMLSLDWNRKQIMILPPNLTEHEVLHWVLVEGKEPGRLALDPESCQRLLDAIQEVRHVFY